MDPEELFRTIFGQFGGQNTRSGGFDFHNMGNFDSNYEPYAESNFGFGSTQEVRETTISSGVQWLRRPLK